jgi:uncharacterized membrane protein
VSRSFAVNALTGAVLVLVAATLIGIVSLWPRERTIPAPPGSVRPKTEAAHVVALRSTPCRAPGATGCVRATIHLDSGPDRGRRAGISVGDGGRVRLVVGDRIRVYRNVLPEGAQLGGVAVDQYVLSDFQRERPLLLLAVGFAALVIGFGRLRGLRALLGLVASLAVVLGFIVPAILEGREPVSVALYGALAVMLVTLPLAHGIGAKTIAAALGTACALFLTLGLASAFTDMAHLTGLSSDEAIYLQTTNRELSLRGLLLAGMVIAALGVLDDLTVSQASTVLALRRANPTLGSRELFREALSVGHDHIAATVNTLVLAYVGASLPVLLIFSVGGTPFREAVNSESVAEQVVAMLVGSIGLIAAVPITTALAALLATRLSPEQLAHEHVHV